MLPVSDVSPFKRWLDWITGEPADVDGTKHPRVEKNVAGQFYVTEACTDCDTCRAAAPDHFRRDEVMGFSYVTRQPTTPDEHARCRRALMECPVRAIHDDGEAADSGKT